MKGLVCMLCAALVLADEAGATGTAVVSEETAAGTITYIGRALPHSREFLGVPFAEQPVGDLRWRAPQPLAPPPAGGATIDATRFGHVCIQEFRPLMVEVGRNTDNTIQIESEACLYLNIYTPANVTSTSKLPVLVFGHGGGDGSGASTQGIPMLFNGTNQASSAGVVSVTINYRLNNYGYLAHPAFESEGEFPTAGNYGLLDHREALRWVQEHIGAFGGDEDKVVFYGQSSGANHALWMLALPNLFTGLLRGVASHSACVSGFFTRFPAGCCMEASYTQAKAKSLAFARMANCSSGDDAAVRDCLRSVGTRELGLLAKQLGGTARPVVDGTVFPLTPFSLFESGSVTPGVDLMIGHNSGEGACDLGIDYAGMREAIAGHVKDNWIRVPEWLLDEAMALYLPLRKDGLDPCTNHSESNATWTDPRELCYQVCIAFYQDMNLQCSEESIVKAMNKGVQAVGQAPPRVFAWRIDQVSDIDSSCPLPYDPLPSDRSAHGMELSWIFGTKSMRGIPPQCEQWPHDFDCQWDCEWSEEEEEFSHDLISRWAAFADSSSPGHGWPEHGGGTTTTRLNFKFSNLTVLEGFRSDKCEWWDTAYARIRETQREQPW